MNDFTGNPPPDEIPIYTQFISLNQILRYPSNLQFRVFYLEAPISVLSQTILDADLVNNLVETNIFHSGIGFQSIDPNFPVEFTFDYNIIEGFNVTGLFPIIEGDELIWNNQASVYLGNYIDRDYWNRSSYIANVNSQQLVQILEWILNDWTPMNPIYVLFSGVRSASREDLFDPIFRSADCFDFAYALIEFMKENQRICIDYPTVPNLTIATFISSFPGSITPVSFEENQQEILDFYTFALDFLNDTIDIDLQIEECIEENGCPLNVYAIENDLFAVTQIYEEIYRNVGVVYIYGYLPDNSLGYWRIVNPNPFIGYVKTNITRSFQAIDIEGQPVVDAFSDPIPTCIFPPSSTLTFTFIIIFIILFIIILVFFILAYTVR